MVNELPHQAPLTTGVTWQFYTQVVVAVKFNLTIQASLSARAINVFKLVRTP